jgi:hypothetical protein
MLRALKFMRLSDAEVRRAWTAVRGRGAVVHRGDTGSKTARKLAAHNTGYHVDKCSVRQYPIPVQRRYLPEMDVRVKRDIDWRRIRTLSV